jgi:predicted metal-binding membrane protein
VDVMQPARMETSRRFGERASRHVFLGVSALLFATTAAGTTVWSASMSAMGGMPMPGGWAMSIASFLGMWVVMTTAMMLPSLTPTLRRYREAMGWTGGIRPGLMAAGVGLGYLFVWFGLGAAAVPLGAALAVTKMGQPALAGAVPLGAGIVVLIAGCFQLTRAKARHLAWCREAPRRDRPLPDGAGAAWRHGLRLGMHCVSCCAGLMVVLLVTAITDVRAMALVAAAITAERLAPAGERVARAIGVVVIGAGLFLIARAAGLG